MSINLAFNDLTADEALRLMHAYKGEQDHGTAPAAAAAAETVTAARAAFEASIPAATAIPTDVAPPPVAEAPSVRTSVEPIASPATVIDNGGIELDAEGIPWDVRIHASSKQKLVKGNTWKLKRGVEAATGGNGKS